MKKVGIIAEFNPFHNGHKYIIEKARELSGADYVIVAMSGDFVQRGAPAFMDKFQRTRIALENGADLVLMLPVAISTASAEGFATGAVRMLYEAGVDTLCFGVECEGELTALTRLAELLINESDEFRHALQSAIKEGCNYPVARARALKEVYGIADEEISIIETPNNQLAIEYIKAIKKAGMEMDYLPIKRVDNGYRSSEAKGRFASASYIRKGLNNAQTCTQKYELGQYLPGYEIDRFVFDYNTRLNDFLHYALLQMASENTQAYETNDQNRYTNIVDLSDDLRDRIINLLPEYKDFYQFADLIKNKSITYTRVCRVLIHILLGITYGDEDVSYLRVLGVRESAKGLLGEITKSSKVPVVVQLSDKKLTVSKDLYAADIYGVILGTGEQELSRRLVTV